MTPTLTIKTNPTKTNYNEGENFDKTGLVLKYTHGNQSSPTVDEIPASSVTITDGTSLKANQTYVTAKYNDLTVRIPITVQKKNENPTPTPNPDPEPTPTPKSFDDKENLKNITTSLDEYKISTKNSKGFDSFRITVNNIKENSGATYKYYYYVSNTKDGTATRQEAKISNGKLVLDIDTEKAGSSFKLNAAGDAIYLTIIQANTTANTEVSSTIQIDGNPNTKIYVDGKFVMQGTNIRGEGTSKGNTTTEFETTEDGTVITNTTTTTTTSPSTTTGDTTIATKKIPQTGTTEEIFKIVIISIALVAGAFIVKSYVINKNINGK